MEARAGRNLLVDAFLAGIDAEAARARLATVAERRINTDPHSPGEWRTNGPLSNMPQFAAAFNCKPGDPMVRDESVRPVIW